MKASRIPYPSSSFTLHLPPFKNTKLLHKLDDSCDLYQKLYSDCCDKFDYPGSKVYLPCSTWTFDHIFLNCFNINGEALKRSFREREESHRRSVSSLIFLMETFKLCQIETFGSKTDSQSIITMIWIVLPI